MNKIYDEARGTSTLSSTRKADHPQIASHAGLSKRVDGLKEGFKVRELATTRSSRRLLRAAGPQESNEKPRVYTRFCRPVRSRDVKFHFDATEEPELRGILVREPRREKTFRCADCIYRHAEPVHQRAEVLIGLPSLLERVQTREQLRHVWTRPKPREFSVEHR